jgi:hypothetical protein
MTPRDRRAVLRAIREQRHPLDREPEHRRQPDGSCSCGAVPATEVQVATAVALVVVPLATCACGAPTEPGRTWCRTCAIREALRPSCALCGGVVPAHRWRMCDGCAHRGAAVTRRFWGWAA